LLAVDAAAGSGAQASDTWLADKEVVASTSMTARAGTHHSRGADTLEANACGQVFLLGRNAAATELLSREAGGSRFAHPQLSHADSTL